MMFAVLKYLFYFISISFFISCTQKQDNKSETNHTQEILRIFLNDPIETLDPAEIIYNSDWRVAKNIYESLVYLTDENKLETNILDSIEVSEDKLNYRFKIKPNIYFQNNPCFKKGKGRKLNSYDVKFMFERLLSPEVKFANKNLLKESLKYENKEYGKTINLKPSIEIIDSSQLRINLSKPIPSFLKLLSTQNFYLIPQEAVEFYKDEFRFNPVGTGPFRATKVEKYQDVTLVKNENYSIRFSNNNKIPFLNSIFYKNIMHDQNSYTELLKNEIDIIFINQDEYLNLLKKEIISDQINAIKVNKSISVRFWCFGFKTRDDEEYKNVRLTTISNYNLDNIIQKNNNLEIAKTLVPSGFLKNEKQNLKFNFKKVTYNDTLKILTNIVSDDLLELESTLIELNIPFKRNLIYENYYNSIIELKADIFRVSMFPAYPDATEYYSMFYSKSSKQLNLGGFNNKNFDLIYEKILIEDNADKLVKYYLELEKILAEEGAAIYLYHSGSKYCLYSKELMGIKTNYQNLDFTQAYFE